MRPHLVRADISIASAARVVASGASPAWDPASDDLASRLLATKLHVPAPQDAVVARDRLIDRVRDGAPGSLTLIVAPAGFGKTTLLADWLARTIGGARAAWVSLDATENDPALFWAYVVRALQRAHPAVGASALERLRASPAAALESVVGDVINDVDALDADVVLALDDYHVVDEPRVHESVAYLIDRLPPRMRIVIATRAEPPLPVARLRARGRLIELRAPELRFTRDETRAFLGSAMSLALSDVDAATLESRTEGWIAGLKLAALSLQGRNDVRGFIDAFSGQHRHVADYLVAEVLETEPESVRAFLLRTSILERLCAPLCEAVAGDAAAQALLERLERRGLFVVPLDDRREWYRYHHLFADVLRAHATRIDPAGVRDAHARASEWYGRMRMTAEAVRHALSAEDAERAASLLEIAWPGKDRSHASATWLAQVKSLPASSVRARPVLGMGFAWALLNGGELEAAEARMRDVERSLAEPDATTIAVDVSRLASLPAELASARVYLAQSSGQTPGTLEHARRALDVVAADDMAGRATGTALVALAHWGRGELDATYDTFSDALALMRADGRPLDAIRGTFVLGDIRATQGRLHAAAAIYEQGLRLASQHDGVAVPETDELHLGLAELDHEWNRLGSVRDRLLAVARSAASAPHAGNRQRWCIAMSRLRAAEGDVAHALDLLDEAERHDVRTPIPRVRPIAATRVRLHLRLGRIGESVAWGARCGLRANDEPTYVREYEHLTLARVLMARHAHDGDDDALRDAARLLERLVVAAEQGGRVGSRIEALALGAAARRALGEVRPALDALAQALALAEPEGYLRVLVDEGLAMRDLLRLATARGLAGAYTPRVLAAFDAPAPMRLAPDAASVVTPRHDAATPLTTRELEIVRLIAAGLRNQEIAAQLAISPATVKRHVANAYGKLGATHRIDAIARAKALGVL